MIILIFIRLHFVRVFLNSGNFFDVLFFDDIRVVQLD